MFINGIIYKDGVLPLIPQKARSHISSIVSVSKPYRSRHSMKSLQFFQLAISSTPCPACLLSDYISFISHHNHTSQSSPISPSSLFYNFFTPQIPKLMLVCNIIMLATTSHNRQFIAPKISIQSNKM